MQQIQPHEFFRLDFDQLLDEAKRQQLLHPANRDEYGIAEAIHKYYQTILPLIINDDWVFKSATEFASQFAEECFRYIKLIAKETYRTQTELLEIKKRVIDILAQAQIFGALSQDLIDIPKESDFLHLLDSNKLPDSLALEAKNLYQEASDHEQEQILVTIRLITASYEKFLPRVMYVIRRAIKVHDRLKKTSVYSTFLGTSESLDWYERIQTGHPLFPVLGKMRSYYKIVRNAESHHGTFEWDSNSNCVILKDERDTLTTHIHELQKASRLLVYVCEYGMRGILAAFSEREKGRVSNQLLKSYIKMFPENFPANEQGRIVFYPER